MGRCAVSVFKSEICLTSAAAGFVFQRDRFGWVVVALILDFFVEGDGCIK